MSTMDGSDLSADGSTRSSGSTKATIKMRNGISITHLEGLLKYAKGEREKYVRLERQELDLVIRELKSRRREGKKLRFKRNKQTRQIVNLAAKLDEAHRLSPEAS